MVERSLLSILTWSGDDVVANMTAWRFLFASSYSFSCAACTALHSSIQLVVCKVQYRLIWPELQDSGGSVT